MNKNIIVGIVITVLLLGGLVFLGQPKEQNDNSANSTSSGVLAAQESSFDFGTVSMAAGPVAHRFKVKNTGADPVNISKMYTSCMCTNASLFMGGKTFGPYGMPGHGFVPKINKAVNPGEEVEVEVVFDPAAHGPAGVGRIERVVYLENNAGAPAELGIEAIVTP